MLKVYHSHIPSSLRRTLSLIFIALFSITLSAQFGGGQGTEADPWQIGRPDHLNNIREFLGAEHNDKFYIQTHDIDLDIEPYNQERGWVPIGSDGQRFYGKYNGAGFLISGLTILGFGEYSGLFGSTETALLQNINLEEVVITGGRYRTGALVGISWNTTIKNCSVEGSVTVTAGSQTSGFVGAAWGCTITDCRTDVTYTTGDSWSGGLIGTCYGGTTVRNCYTTGTVNSTGNNRQNIGGLFGMLSSATVINSYSSATVIANQGSNRVGGLVGRNLSGTVTDCYSMGRVTNTNNNAGGLLGTSEDSQVSGSYWDTQTSEMEISAAGEGRATRQMVYPYDTQTTYVRWNFDDVWTHDLTGTINDGYPILHYQSEPPELLDTPEVAINLITQDNIEYIRLSWEQITDALSYRIYGSSDPNVDNWGEPIVIVGEDITQYSQPVSEADRIFFYVIASTQEPPEGRSSNGKRRIIIPNTSLDISSENSRFPPPNHTLNEFGELIRE